MRKSGQRLDLEGEKEFEPLRLDFENPTENISSEDLESVGPENLIENIPSEEKIESETGEAPPEIVNTEDKSDDLAQDDEKEMQQSTSGDALEDGENAILEKQTGKKSGRGKDKVPRKRRQAKPTSASQSGAGTKKPRLFRAGSTARKATRKYQKKKAECEEDATPTPEISHEGEQDELLPPSTLMPIKSLPPGPPGPPGPTIPGPPRTVLNFSNLDALNDLVKDIQ